MKKMSSILFMILTFLLLVSVSRIIGHYLGGIASLFFCIFVIAGILFVAYIVRPNNKGEVRGLGTRLKERLESNASRYHHNDAQRIEPLDLYVPESKYNLSPEEDKQWELIENAMIDSSYDEPISIPKLFKKRKKKNSVRIM